jgi:hypothetical protein
MKEEHCDAGKVLLASTQRYSCVTAGEQRTCDPASARNKPNVISHKSVRLFKFRILRAETDRLVSTISIKLLIV